jgi:hypothetical protein
MKIENNTYMKKIKNILFIAFLMLVNSHFTHSQSFDKICDQFPLVSNIEKKELLKSIFPNMEVRRFVEPAFNEFTTGTSEDKERALLRIKLITEAYFEKEVALNSSDAHHSKSIKATFGTCFFSQAYYFQALYPMVKSGKIDKETLRRAQIIAEQSLLIPENTERGPNNRPFHYAIGNINAANIFPYSKYASKWRGYANGVWSDWYIAGDTYEPGYVAHNLKQIIELGLLLDKKKELCSDRIRQTFYRYRDHISSSGLTFAPGDGNSQADYLPAFIVMAEITGDPTLYWAAEQTFWAGNYSNKGGARRNRYSAKDQELYNKEFAVLIKMGIKPQMPATSCAIQEIFPSTYKVKERLLMSASRQTGNPFVGYYLLDCGETTHHAHEDNRGEIYHYEVDSVMYLSRSGWSKWVGHANTFVVEDAANEFPFYNTQGMIKDYWYKGSTNMRILRNFQASVDYVFKTSDKSAHDKLFVSSNKNEMGYYYVNPDALAGKCDQIQINEIALRINSMPRNVQAKSSYNPGMLWYREYRDIAPCDESKTILIDNISISGPAGKKVLFDFENTPTNIEIKLYPLGSLTDTSLIKTLTGNEIFQVITLVDSKSGGGKVLQVRSDLGRTDVIFKNIKINVNFNKTYNRIDFDYCYQSDVSEFLRPSLKVAVNEQAPRSMYIDRQQGGILMNSNTDQHGDDCFSSFTYNGIFTYDSNWTRKTVLTKEGYLIVVDEYLPGNTADGMIGGPVWQLMNPPQAGMNWFDALAGNSIDKKLMVYFHPDRKNRYGSQAQFKFQNDKNYAVYAQTRLKANVSSRFVTVMVPHDAAKDGIEISGKTNYSGLISAAKDSKTNGITTSLDSIGNAFICIKANNLMNKSSKVEVVLTQNGSWEVKR